MWWPNRKATGGGPFGIRAQANAALAVGRSKPGTHGARFLFCFFTSQNHRTNNEQPHFWRMGATWGMRIGVRIRRDRATAHRAKLPPNLVF
jgi:hypothetical protein